MKHFVKIIAAILLASATVVYADESAFSTGPVFDFGPTAEIDADMIIPEGTTLKHAFDTSKQADIGEINKTLSSAARFINMHVRAGIPQEDIHVAVVVHSTAAFDLTKDEFYASKTDGADNGNKDAIAALTDAGVRIILCGQTAAYHGVDNDDLLPGVDMALSAMTAHALLQQDGYTLNPF